MLSFILPSSSLFTTHHNNTRTDRATCSADTLLSTNLIPITPSLTHPFQKYTIPLSHSTLSISPHTKHLTPHYFLDSLHTSCPAIHLDMSLANILLHQQYFFVCCKRKTRKSADREKIAKSTIVNTLLTFSTTIDHHDDPREQDKGKTEMLYHACVQLQRSLALHCHPCIASRQRLNIHEHVLNSFARPT